MSTLSVNGLIFDILGAPSWGTGGHHAGRPLVPFIGATVRVPPSVPTIKLDSDNAHVVLMLDNGRRIEGRGMWLVGGLRTNDDIAPVRYEGGDVTEHH
jgi:hypothetical protein